MSSHIPTTLLDLFETHLILAQLTPYLPGSALINLTATSRRFNEVIHDDPKAFRRLDVSAARGVPYEDCECEGPEEHKVYPRYSDEDHWDGYWFPLRELRKRNILPTVQTLILDNQWVHLDALRSVLLDPASQIRLLSLIGVHSFYQTDFLDDLVRDLVSLGKPTTRIEGIYYFGAPVMWTNFSDQLVEERAVSANTAILTEKSEISNAEEDSDPWYSSKVACQPLAIGWPSYTLMLEVTQGALAWDAVICRGPRHINVPLTIANVALGPRGCYICHSSPEGPGSNLAQLPLLSPPPLYSSSIKVAQGILSNDGHSAPLPFYARCLSCLQDRWCSSCNKWFCEDCYQLGAPNCYKKYDTRGPDSAGTRVGCSLLATDCVNNAGCCSVNIQSLFKHRLLSISSS